MHKNIFVIVEGPDASGKTSIAKALAKRMNALFFERTADLKADTSKQHSQKYYEDIGRRLSSRIRGKLNKSSIVIARYIYSIPAIRYALIRRKIPIITGIVKPDYIVYCYANQRELRERIRERLENGEQVTELERNPEEYKRLCERYDQLFRKEGNVIRVDTSNKTIDESVNEILKSLKIN